MIVQAIFTLIAAIVIWKGSAAFRKGGLRIGVFNDHDKPLPKETGIIIGVFLIMFGTAILLCGLFIAPSLFPDL